MGLALQVCPQGQRVTHWGGTNSPFELPRMFRVLDPCHRWRCRARACYINRYTAPQIPELQAVALWSPSSSFRHHGSFATTLKRQATKQQQQQQVLLLSILCTLAVACRTMCWQLSSPGRVLVLPARTAHATQLTRTFIDVV